MGPIKNILVDCRMPKERTQSGNHTMTAEVQMKTGLAGSQAIKSARITNRGDQRKNSEMFQMPIVRDQNA
jgi:hypothetical protein